MDIFDKIDYEELHKAKGEEIIGCPFSDTWGGVVMAAFLPRFRNEHLCRNFCGVLFKRGYEPNRCPCHVMNREYVKRKFWSEFDASIQRKLLQ